MSLSLCRLLLLLVLSDRLSLLRKCSFGHSSSYRPFGRGLGLGPPPLPAWIGSGSQPNPLSTSPLHVAVPRCRRCRSSYRRFGFLGGRFGLGPPPEPPAAGLGPPLEPPPGGSQNTAPS